MNEEDATEEVTPLDYIFSVEILATVRYYRFHMEWFLSERVER